mmetsp:Transcript_29140/g.69591  ORF Transcript_29140/g.69591 Transcript_29140/m.69591 type:complete len:405 (-) Transcript_29140:97-1311(-)
MAICALRNFYLLEWSVQHCFPSGNELFLKVKTLPYTRRQHLGPEVFLRQQLSQHPCRTYRPENAALFILPSIFGLLYNGFSSCNLTYVFGEFSRELQKSWWYHRNNGSDHLLVVSCWQAQQLILNPELAFRTIRDKYSCTSFRLYMVKKFARAAREFISTSHLRAGGVFNGWRWSPETAKIFPIPYLAPSILQFCKYNATTGQVVCKVQYSRRQPGFQYILFFVGNLARKGAAIRSSLVLRTHEHLRQSALASTTFISGLRKCNTSTPFHSCILPNLSDAFYHRFYSESLFSVHMRGDDSSSSRFYDALSFGSPQIVVADRFLTDGAPFVDTINYKNFVNFVPESDVLESQLELYAVTNRFLEDEGAYQSLVNNQTMYMHDLLWHVSGSKVGHNIIKEALNYLT